MVTTRPGEALGSVSEPAPTSAQLAPRRLRFTSDAAIGLALAAGLATLAFVTTGGVDLGPNTWAEIVLSLLGAAVAIAVLLIGAPGRAWGLVTLALFAALALLTAASVLWSVAPESSWIESGRTVSYLAAFGGALAAGRLLPGRWPAVVGAIATLTAVIGGYAVLVKVFPAALDPGETYGRLRSPFDYFNATGLIAALGLPACVWAGARRERARALRAMAVPAVSVLGTVIVLSYSRGAMLAAVFGLAVWFVMVPLRLRGALVLALGLAGAAVLSLYALETHALTHDLVPLHSRSSAGRGFGVLIALVLVLQTIVGFAAAAAMDRVILSARARRRLGVALLTLVAMVPLGGVAALAESSRGLTGQISHIYSSLTNANGVVYDTPGRLVQLGNSRARYWSEGLTVGEHAPLIGAGALGYATAVTRYTTDTNTVAQAHSFVIETFADFGLLGVAVMIALLSAWVLAVRRTVTAAGTADHAAEHAGLLTLLGVVIVFGVHSAIDWTWSIPGTAVPALICAGWLAGRGPLAQPVGRAPRRRQLTASPGTSAAVLAILALTLLCAWAIWQPLRSANASDAATSALERGDTAAAIGDARTAASVDPVAVAPLWQLAAIYAGGGDRTAARAELVSATRRQPENPQSWLQLGEFDLQAGHPRQALISLSRAVMLDRGSAEASANLASAERLAPAGRRGR